LVTALAPDGVNQHLVLLDPIEDSQVAFAQLELELSRRPAQAEAMPVLDGGIVVAQCSSHRGLEPRTLSGTE
jgi:hypothetical protein